MGDKGSKRRKKLDGVGIEICQNPPLTFPVHTELRCLF